MGNSSTRVTQPWLWPPMFFCGCWKYILLSYNPSQPHFPLLPLLPAAPSSPLPPLHFPNFKVLFDWLFLLYFCNWLPKVFCAHVHWSTHVPTLTHTSDTHNNNNNTHKKTGIIFSQDAPHAMWMPQLVNYICIFGCLEQSSVHKKWSEERRASTHSPPCTQAQLPFHHHPVGEVYPHQSMNRQSPCFTSSLALGLYSTGFGKSIMTCNYSYGISQNTCTAPNQTQREHFREEVLRVTRTSLYPPGRRWKIQIHIVPKPPHWGLLSSMVNP